MKTFVNSSNQNLMINLEDYEIENIAYEAVVKSKYEIEAFHPIIRYNMPEAKGSPQLNRSSIARLNRAIRKISSNHLMEFHVCGDLVKKGRIYYLYIDYYPIALKA